MKTGKKCSGETFDKEYESKKEYQAGLQDPVLVEAAWSIQLQTYCIALMNMALDA